MTTIQHTIRMFTKTVKLDETITTTSTVAGCSTFTTTVTSGSTTTTAKIHPAESTQSQGCQGSASCTVTTTVATDVDVPTSTTSAGKPEFSGHEVVEVVSEQQMKEIMAAEKRKKEMAEKKKEQEIADKGLAAELIARRDIASPSFDTTLMTIMRLTPHQTGDADAITITQSPSYPAKKPRSETSKVGMAESGRGDAPSTLACITLRSQGAYSTICPDSSCCNGNC